MENETENPVIYTDPRTGRHWRRDECERALLSIMEGGQLSGMSGDARPPYHAMHALAMQRIEERRAKIGEPKGGGAYKRRGEGGHG